MLKPHFSMIIIIIIFQAPPSPSSSHGDHVCLENNGDHVWHYMVPLGIVAIIISQMEFH